MVKCRRRRRSDADTQVVQGNVAKLPHKVMAWGVGRAAGAATAASWAQRVVLRLA
jgi:hypothetical protein